MRPQLLPCLSLLLAILLPAVPLAAQGPRRQWQSQPARPAPGGVLFVDAAATGAATGTSWGDAFRELQAALATAAAGDEIWVAAGTYTPSDTDATASFQLKSGVALYGGFAGGETARDQRDWVQNPTVLSGDIGRDDQVGSGPGWYLSWNINTANCGHVVVGTGTDRSAVLDGFTVANGSTGPAGTGAGDPLMYGSGLFNLPGSPTVRNCTFTHNLAAFASGGGVYNQDSDPLFENCRFLENYTHGGNGGGMMNAGTSAPVIRDCSFTRNHCVVAGGPDASGGGLYHYGSVPITLERCVFEDNHARPFYPVGSDVGYGGGVSAFVAGIQARDCVFIGNSAQMGGGLMTWGPSQLVNCLFVDNDAIVHPNDPWPEVGGIGAGVAISSSRPDDLVLIHCTLSYNHGKKYSGAVGSWFAKVVLQNSIVWGNTATHPDVLGTWREELGGSFDAFYSCIRLIFDPPGPGEDPILPADVPGTIDLDPLFVRVGFEGDYHLLAGSPCIDAADNTAVPAAVTGDLDGAPRFQDDPAVADTGVGPAPVADMGAYEAPGTAPLTGGPPLRVHANRSAVSLARGGLVRLELDAGPAHGGEKWRLLPSGPPGGVAPALLAGRTGRLDASGRAVVFFMVPPGSAASLAGRSLRAVFVLESPGSSASLPAEIRLIR